MFWVKTASVLMFIAVMLGAFGSHALRGRITDHYMDVYKTAVLYHMVHALALFAVAWLSTVTRDPKVGLAGIFFCAGIALFSGSLYVFSTTGIKWLGAVTPLGGICFLVGWALLALTKGM